MIPDINVILLCGIPGVGKTYLAENLTVLLKEFFEDKFEIEVEKICFDEIFHSRILSKNKSQNNKFHDKNDLQHVEIKYDFECDLYHKSRDEFLILYQNRINEYFDILTNLSLVQAPIKMKKRFLFIDDNFYFKSMRKPFYKFLKDKIKSEVNNKLNKDLSCSYLEVILKCQLDYALKNNSNRTDLDFIPEHVIANMNEKMEYESFIKNFIHIFNVESKENIQIENLRSTKFIEESLLSELIYSRYLIEETIKSEIAEENLNLNKETKKDLEAELINVQGDFKPSIKHYLITFLKQKRQLFLTEFELALRKFIGDLYSKNNEILNRENVKIFRDYLDNDVKKEKDQDVEEVIEFGKLSLEYTSKNDIQRINEIFLHLLVAILNGNKIIEEVKDGQKSPINKNQKANKLISPLKTGFFTFVKNEALNDILPFDGLENDRKQREDNNFPSSIQNALKEYFTHGWRKQKFKVFEMEFDMITNYNGVDNSFLEEFTKNMHKYLDKSLAFSKENLHLDLEKLELQNKKNFLDLIMPAFIDLFNVFIANTLKSTIKFA